MVCNCTPEDLEIPGVVLTHHPGMSHDQPFHKRYGKPG
jgi:hypothetical protein